MSTPPLLLSTESTVREDGGHRIVLTLDGAAGPVAPDRLPVFYRWVPSEGLKVVWPAGGQIVAEGNTYRIDLPATFLPGERILFAAYAQFEGWHIPGYVPDGRGWFFVPDPAAPPAEGVQLDRWAEGPRWTTIAGLHLHFSEAVERATGQVTVKLETGEVVATYDIGNQQAVEVVGTRLSIPDRDLLLDGARYVVELSAGALRDADGQALQAFSTTWTTRPGAFYGEDGDDYIHGTPRMDDIFGADGRDTAMGGGDDDWIANIELAVYRGNRSEYKLEMHEDDPSSGVQALTIFTKSYFHTIEDQVPGRDGNDLLRAVRKLWFEDYLVDLHIGWMSELVAAEQVKLLQELYIAFFNRIPEAAGMQHWLAELRSGTSLATISDRFHEAGVAFGVYEAGMADDGFITALYTNVLGRGPESATAPSDAETGFWRGLLESGSHSRGGIVLKMLQDVHAAFEDHPVYGFVERLLDNKAALAHYYAVEQGLGRHTQAEDIAFGKQLAALVTPDDISAAIALIGIDASPA